MQKKSLETILYSSAGIAVMLVLLIAANVIVGAGPVRVDMTQEKAYTLSAGTKAVLAKLDTPVKIRFYCTQSGTATPESVYLKNYARKVEDLLQEYRQAAGRNLTIEKYDPQPDSDAEDSAKLDGMEAQSLPGADRFYLGLAVTLADQRVAIPFLKPNRERELEYDITRAIARVFSPEKPVVGVMSALPVFGDTGPTTRAPGQTGGAAWTIIDLLKQDYTVKPVELNAEKIDDDIKALVVIHPQGITDKGQYALDQFVLRGGKLIAFLDAESAVAARSQNPMAGGRGGMSSTLDKLLPAWGVQFDDTKVVADLNYKMQLRGNNGQPMEAPAWLAVTGDGINRDDIVTSQLGDVWLPMSGAFTGEPAAGLKETVLLKSSTQSELVNSFMAGMGGDTVLNGFKADGLTHKLAIRLTGKFKTAFPNGPPGQTNNAAAESLKESKTDTAVVLFGDADLLADDYSLRKIQSIFGTMVTSLNANLELAQNLVGQMAGDSNLIGVRSRATMNRPFTLIKQLEADAQARGQAKIAELQQSLNDTQRRLGELQQQKTGADQRLILSAEQQAEIDNFRQKQASVSKELKQAQKDLRKEVVSLEDRMTWMNILVMPLAITAAGLSMAVIKRKKTSAQ